MEQQQESKPPHPLTPQGQDKNLAQKTEQTFKEGQEQIQRLEEAEKQKSITEAFDKVRSLGFATKQDIEEAISSKAEQINKAFEEIQQIKAYLKSVQTPAQNSGLLDSPSPPKKNPLLLW